VSQNTVLGRTHGSESYNWSREFGRKLGYVLDDRGLIPTRDWFPFPTAIRPALGPTHPPVQWVPGLKWPGRDADPLPLSNAEVKNAVLNSARYTYSWCGT
jgi:hypothetical protein